MTYLRIIIFSLVLVFGFFLESAMALNEQTIVLVIKDHQFIPSTIEVPAGQKIKIIIDNQDPTPEEFESFPLNREKVVSANSKAVIFIGPLKAGIYPFVGEFHQSTAKGQIIVRTGA